MTDERTVIEEGDTLESRVVSVTTLASTVLPSGVVYSVQSAVLDDPKKPILVQSYDFPQLSTAQRDNP